MWGFRETGERTEQERPHVLMVSSYLPASDGIASYTSRLVCALQREKLAFVKLARRGVEWKPNSLIYLAAILRRALRLNVNIVHIQCSYFMFGNEYYTGLLPILMIVLRLLGKTCVVTFHDVVPRQNVTTSFLKEYTSSHFLSLKRLAFGIYTSLVCKVSHTIIVHQKLAMAVLAAQYNVPEIKIEIIPHGIDADPDIESCSDPENDCSLVVTYFGLIRHGKGLEDLIRAWSIVVSKLDAMLQIIGGKHPYLDDGCYEKIIGLVDKLGVNSSVTFRGFVPKNDLPRLFADTDVFVFPYNEWGNVIASSGALSMVAPFRKPLVVTDIPAFADLKKCEAALVVRRGSIDDLSNAITKALTDDQMASCLTRGFDELLLESSWSSVARKTASLYRSMMCACA